MNEPAEHGPDGFWCRTWVKVAGFLPMAIVVAIGIFGYFHTLPRTDYGSGTPTVDRSRPLMVALGDSFIAGEGAGYYLAGTNDEGSNTCHRANSAYPFLVAKNLDYRLVSAACSGAVTANVTDLPQHKDSPDGVYGAEPQLQHLMSSDLHDDPSDVDVVVLSIGGNDAKFSDVVKSCLLDNCIPKTHDWMANVNKLAPKLYATYTAIGELVPNARKIVMTYPDLIAPGTCKDRLKAPEVAWVRLKFLPRLDRIIAAEAANAGWEVVDDTNAFLGARICEPRVPESKWAANFLKFDQLHGPDANGDLVRGSFHPRPLGHLLFAQYLQQTLDQPAPTLATCTPFEACPPPSPPEPDVPPPGTRQDLPADLPKDTPCKAGQIANQVVVIVVDERSEDLDAQPGSGYCYREWAGDWRTGHASDSGKAHLTTVRLADQDTLSIEVLTRQADDTWTRTVLNAEPRVKQAGQGLVGALAAYILIAIVAGTIVLMTATAPFVLCALARRRAQARAAEQPTAPPAG